MSNVFDTFSSYGQLIDDAVSEFTAFYSNQRQLGGIFPDVVTEELHNDELTMTEQPVEIGAPVTDHAWMQPYKVLVNGGFSNSSAGSEGWVQAAYQQLLGLQQSKQPFDISTGKRYYVNMLLRSLTVITNEDSEFSLMFRAACQQIILVSTQSGASSLPANTDGSFAPSGIPDGTSPAAITGAPGGDANSVASSLGISPPTSPSFLANSGFDISPTASGPQSLGAATTYEP